jgi:hypothetical protein
MNDKLVEVKVAAARWAVALMEMRPSDTVDEQEALVEVLQKNAADVPPCLCSSLWAALERDDEDVYETARMVFDALAMEQ